MMPDGCRKPPLGSLPNSRKPRKPPTNEPTIPRTIVSRMPMLCLPGMTARAMRPAIRPMMIRPRMVQSMFLSFCLVDSAGGAGSRMR